VTPAYINPDGSPGESFLVLKMRSALLKALRYRERFGPAPRAPLRFFQMTSAGTDAPLREAYAGYRSHPWLAPLIEGAGSDPTRPLSAVQPLIAALSPASEGSPRRIFDRAYGKEDSALALPGGHGQSFRVLAGVYRELLALGYRYAYIGNVDNVGYSVDPVELALMALSGADAAFDFSYRTALDVKGGILVLDERGAMTVGDLGQAISNEEAEALEAGGARILFNCATGLFDLAALVARLDDIAATLPLRVSEQDKDAGRYSQAEQSTWEVVGCSSGPWASRWTNPSASWRRNCWRRPYWAAAQCPPKSFRPSLPPARRAFRKGLEQGPLRTLRISAARRPMGGEGLIICRSGTKKCKKSMNSASIYHFS
jgi:UTP--glucose-1-phosphate uridylyltransferase